MPDNDQYQIDPEAEHPKLIGLLNTILEDLRDGVFRGNGSATVQDQTAKEIINMRDWLEACDEVHGQKITAEQSSAMFGAIVGKRKLLIGKNRVKHWGQCRTEIAKILKGELPEYSTVERYVAPIHHAEAPNKPDNIAPLGQIQKIEKIMDVLRKECPDDQLAELQQIAMRWWEVKKFRQVVRELAQAMSITQRELLSYANQEKLPQDSYEPGKVIELKERVRGAV